MKLNSVNPVFPRRICQNNSRMVNNRNRQAIDGRLPQNHILQQSAYGTFNIINESITNTISASIRSGEAFFYEKESKVNAVKQATVLPKLLTMLTFNDRWEEFAALLPNPGRSMPSNYPWEGVEKSTEQMIAEVHVLADIPDPELEPILFAPVMAYQIYRCADHICGGPGSGRDGRC
ncbi:hypothetical protein BDZ45DRAFT_751079 [Acephala macrosclerotiorum]|nr:hypothetical protein BDZ45DRAFT_751079 [Acephala macrosclerotiorum]